MNESVNGLCKNGIVRHRGLGAVLVEARSGFSPADLRAAALLTRGEPETVEDLLEIGERVLRDSTHIDPAHDHADTA